MARDQDIDNAVNYASVELGSYETAVLEASDVPVIFLDPDGLGGKTYSEDIPMLRAQIEGQNAAVASQMSDDFLQNLASSSHLGGPFAMRYETLEGVQFCIVNKPAEFIDEPHELASLLAKVPPEQLADIPGDKEIWNRAIGIHEGAHCNQDFNNAAQEWSPNVTVLKMEAGADKAAIDDLRQQGHHDVAEALRDYRALSAFSDPKHATSALLDDADFNNAGRYYGAAGVGYGYIVDEVSKRLEIPGSDVQAMSYSDVQQFSDAVRETLQEGGFDYWEDLKSYVEDYTQAAQRQVVAPGQSNNPMPESSPPAWPKGVEEMLKDIIYGDADDPSEEIEDIHEKIEEILYREPDVNPETPVPPDAERAPTPTETVNPHIHVHGHHGHGRFGMENTEPEIIRGDLRDEMRIGDMPVSAYFGAQADPAQPMAGKELHNEQVNEAENVQENIRSASNAPSVNLSS